MSTIPILFCVRKSPRGLSSLKLVCTPNRIKADKNGVITLLLSRNELAALRDVVTVALTSPAAKPRALKSNQPSDTGGEK